jgi:hypothetical protein
LKTGNNQIGTEGTFVDPRALALNVHTSADTLTVELTDGRSLSVPIVWFPKLATAEASARDNWVILGDGEGIHWPTLDEDLSVAGLLAGQRPR